MLETLGEATLILNTSQVNSGLPPLRGLDLKTDPLVSMVLVIAILVGLGAGFLLGNTNVRTVTSISTTGTFFTTTLTLHSISIFSTTVRATTTTKSTATSPGIELTARVAPTNITQGQNISITYGVYNPLSTPFTINVTAFRNQYLGPCPISQNPDTYYLYAGRVTFSNLAFNTPLYLFNPSVIVSCASSFNSTFVFQPDSYLATVYSAMPAAGFLVNFTSAYSGYWVRSTGNSYLFSEFTPGEYSVLITDSWGQRALEYFVVSP
jgi:hypothetical protein